MPTDPLARDFLSRLNALVRRKVTVVLIGGNALIFLGLKQATKDVDIACRSAEPEVAKFCREYKEKYKVKIEFFVDGLFKHIRIKDYLTHSYPYEQAEFPNIKLMILNIYDIILTKINRFLDRDIEDIENVLKQTDISRGELDKRFRHLYKFTMLSNKKTFLENYARFKKLLGHLLKP